MFDGIRRTCYTFYINGGAGSMRMSKEESQAILQIDRAISALKEKEVYALVIEKDTFEPYILPHTEESVYTLGREEAIKMVTDALDEQDCIVSTTGMISRELFEYRTTTGQGHGRDFLTVGSMGHANQIALGIALAQPDRRVWCFDGDGAILMHLGSLAIIADKTPENFIHVVFNNGAHDSVGGQPTVGLKIDLPAIAEAVGYKVIYSTADKADLSVILSNVKHLKGPVFIEVKVKKGNRKDLGRPTTTPVQNKTAFMDFLKK